MDEVNAAAFKQHSSLVATLPNDILFSKRLSGSIHNDSRMAYQRQAHRTCVILYSHRLIGFMQQGYFEQGRVVNGVKKIYIIVYYSR